MTDKAGEDAKTEADRQYARDYLYDMLKQLAGLARKNGERFVADALIMVLQEATRPSRGRYAQ